MNTHLVLGKSEDLRSEIYTLFVGTQDECIDKLAMYSELPEYSVHQVIVVEPINE